MAFTLNKLAMAMRGMPRDARILIRLPDGRLVDIDQVAAAYVREDNSTLPDSGGAAGYGIILVASDPGTAAA